MEASALSWHLTNKRDTGRITTRDWNRGPRVLAIVNSAGWEIARFLGDTAVHQPIQSVFLIFHQSELPRTASDNRQPILAPQHPSLPATGFISTIGAYRKGWQPCFVFFRQILGSQKSSIHRETALCSQTGRSWQVFSVRNVTFSRVVDLSAFLTSSSCLHFII